MVETAASSAASWGARIGAGARLEAETIVGEGALVPAGARLSGGRVPSE
jgi:carbonic anhydrase/acetyltransferase-like protein (isoleucine patch superfamily)